MSTVVHHLAPALRARLLGLACVAAGVLVILLMIAGAFLELSTMALAAGAAVIVVAALAMGFWAVRPRAVLRLDSAGYEVRVVRGGGASAARWDQVEDVRVVEAKAGAVLQLRLRDGRATLVPLAALAAPAERVIADVRGFLDGRRA